MDKTLTTTKGNYEIKVSDIFNGTTVKDGPGEDVPNNPTFTTVGNAPDINGFNKENTYYVSWDLTSSPYEINEDTNLNGVAPSDWYDYTEGVNHWANVKTIGGGNDCYWVWIPRYAYQVPTRGDTAEMINVKFLKETTNEPIDGSSITISNNTTKGSWNIHPAFWFDENNNGIEDEGEQLTGIWVAKYEASSSDVGAINLQNGILTGDVASLDGTGGGADTSLHVRVKPNVTSWRELNVNGIFEVCQNLITNGNSLQGTTNLDSHMMKNTEWGAVAYLSSSKYGKTNASGRRVRIYNNPYYHNSKSYSPITGLSGVAAAQVNNAKTTNLYIYNTQEGVEASTTGNVYGIYDMAGGAAEYTATIYKVGTSNENISEIWKSTNLKYVDQYKETTGSQSTYFGNTTKYGDAVYETSKTGFSSIGSWEGTTSQFLTSVARVFLRGGGANLGSNTSIFSFAGSSGGAYTSYCFRPVVINTQP